MIKKGTRKMAKKGGEGSLTKWLHESSREEKKNTTEGEFCGETYETFPAVLYRASYTRTYPSGTALLLIIHIFIYDVHYTEILFLISYSIFICIFPFHARSM